MLLTVGSKTRRIFNLTGSQRLGVPRSQLAHPIVRAPGACYSNKSTSEGRDGNGGPGQRRDLFVVQ